MRERAVQHIKKIKRRASEILLFLMLEGPATIAEMADSIKESTQRARYALGTLRKAKEAYISDYVVLTGDSLIPRWTSIYSAGEFDDVAIPSGAPGYFVEGLDFRSTKHLQPLYMSWAATRTPDYETDTE